MLALDKPARRLQPKGLLGGQRAQPMEGDRCRQGRINTRRHDDRDQHQRAKHTQFLHVAALLNRVLLTGPDVHMRWRPHSP